MNLVASSLPGRLRLRHPALRNPVRLDQLRTAIAGWPQVQSVAGNAQAGSLLVRYDAASVAEETCAKRCEAALRRLLPSAETGTDSAPASPVHPAHGGTRRVRANRLAKRGMLASLTVSLLLAAVGSKRWHALAGIAFLHALAVHLWVHRRHVLR